MTVFNKLVFIAILGVFTHSVSAQEGLPIYSDYLTDNYYLLHPSMAGVSNCNKLDLQVVNSGLEMKMLQVYKR